MSFLSSSSDFLVSFFLFFPSMTNLANIRDSNWLADKISLDHYATHLIVGDSRTIHGLLFDLPSSRA